VLIFGWGASRNGLILLSLTSLSRLPDFPRTAGNYDLSYAVLLILAFRTKSGGALHEDILVPRINGKVVVFWGLLAFSFSPSSSQIPTKVHRRYLAYDWSIDAGNKPGSWRKKAGMADFSNRTNSFSSPFRYSNVYVYVYVYIYIFSRFLLTPRSQRLHPLILPQGNTTLLRSKLQVGWTPK
jgi:hypothetical protein